MRYSKHSTITVANDNWLGKALLLEPSSCIIIICKGFCNGLKSPPNRLSTSTRRQNIMAAPIERKKRKTSLRELWR